MRLSLLHPTLTREERVELAARSGISTGYLWQIATRWQGRRPTVDVLARLAKADARLTVDDLVEEFADAGSPAVRADTHVGG